MAHDDNVLISFSDIREIASWGEDGFAYKASDELTDEAAATIAGIVETVTRTRDGRKRRTLTIKLHDKVRSLELLGRHLGIFTDRINMCSPPAAGFVIRLEGLPDKPQKPISEGDKHRSARGHCRGRGGAGGQSGNASPEPERGEERRPWWRRIFGGNE